MEKVRSNKTHFNVGPIEFFMLNWDDFAMKFFVFYGNFFGVGKWLVTKCEVGAQQQNSF